jgi:hypothetical protein
MLAAAATLWAMFSLWIVAPHVGLARPLERAAATLLAVEFVALLVWSYGTEGCESGACTAFPQVAGIAARTDVPLLACVLVMLAVADLTRAWRMDAGRRRRDSVPRRA